MAQYSSILGTVLEYFGRSTRVFWAQYSSNSGLITQVFWLQYRSNPALNTQSMA